MKIGIVRVWLRLAFFCCGAGHRVAHLRAGLPQGPPPALGRRQVLDDTAPTMISRPMPDPAKFVDLAQEQYTISLLILAQRFRLSSLNPKTKQKNIPSPMARREAFAASRDGIREPTASENGGWQRSGEAAQVPVPRFGGRARLERGRQVGGLFPRRPGHGRPPEADTARENRGQSRMV